MPPAIDSDVVVHHNLDGRLEAFARGSDNQLWHVWQRRSPNGLRFESYEFWESLGGNIRGTPAVHHNQDGRLEVFAKGNDGNLHHIWQTQSNRGYWSNWKIRNQRISSDPVVEHNQDGRLEVFARRDNSLFHIWQTAPNNGWSRGTTKTSRNIYGKPVVHHNQDGRLEVFAKGNGNNLLHIWQTAPNNGWSNWSSLDFEVSGTPAVHHNQDGRLEVFARQDTSWWHVWQIVPNGGWSNWERFDGYMIYDPAVTLTNSGHLVVAGRNFDDLIVEMHQKTPNSNNWQNARVIFGTGNSIGTPSMHVDYLGKLHILSKFRPARVGNVVLENNNTVNFDSWSSKTVRNLHALPGVGINVIMVGEHFTVGNRNTVISAIRFARRIFEKVNFTIKYFTMNTITNPNNKYFFVDQDSAEDLTDEIRFDNNYIDMFVVQEITDADGWSPLPGPCDKDSKGMSGIVVDFTQDVQRLGKIIAHEIGHFSGLDPTGNGYHNPTADNFMNGNPGTDITMIQRSFLIDTCHALPRWE